MRTDGAPSLGPERAPVTIVEFSDFNCPYCQQWHQTTFGPIMDAFPDQIRFVYRDFPILSQESAVAAQAAHCAADQGAYWEFHDALFSGRYSLGREAYIRYANEIGLDAVALEACLDQGRYAGMVQDSASYAAGLGITGTPTFFINGIRIVGSQPLQNFVQIIRSELN